MDAPVDGPASESGSPAVLIGRGGAKRALELAADGGSAVGTAAGDDLEVVIMAGATTIRSAIDAGLVDVLTLHVAPVILGAGTPLFTGTTERTLAPRTVISTPNATHLTYDVR